MLKKERFLEHRKQQEQNRQDSSFKRNEKYLQRESFWSDFRNHSQTLSNMLNSVKPSDFITSNQRHELWNNLSIKYKYLDDMFNETNSLLLPSSDVRIVQEELDALLYRLIQVKATIVCPKSKFMFRRYHEWKRRIGLKYKYNRNEIKEEKESSANDFEEVSFPISSRIIENKSNENITIIKEQEGMPKVLEKSLCLVLKQLSNCNITLQEEYQTLHLISLKQCTINCQLSVLTSILFRFCSNCSFYVSASRQLRIHDSNNCSFHINVTAGCIIENCYGMKFWKYNLKEEQNDHNNKWKDVKDFSWLSGLKPSPNFTIMEEANSENMNDSIIKRDIDDKCIIANHRLKQSVHSCYNVNENEVDAISSEEHSSGEDDEI